MGRMRGALAVLMLAVLLPAIPVYAATVTHGPLLGLVEPDLARVWLRTDAPATVQLEYATGTGVPQSTPGVVTAAATDFTAQFELVGLQPETLYWYRTIVNGTRGARVYRFMTAPPYGAEVAFSFALFSDFFPKPAPSHYAAKALGPAFALDLGDKDHRNPGSLDEMRRMHRELRGSETLYGMDFKAVFIDADPQLPNGRTWDDHDYCRNDSSERCPRRDLALQAAGEYFVFTADNGYPQGIWHRYRYANVEFFILDLRSNRDPSAGHRTITGDEQMAWLLDRLAASTARWKFLVSSVPFHGKLDGWQGYKVDRQKVVDHVRSRGIAGVIVLSGDIHSGGAIDDGTNAFFPELSVPFANEGFAGTGFGPWSVGLISGEGPGFAWVDVTAESVVLKAYSAAGQLRLQYEVR